MNPLNPPPPGAKPRWCRVPDFGPWPPVGFVPPRKVMAALGVRSDETLRNYEKAGLLPPREPINGNQTGWRVEVIRAAIEVLPDKMRARSEQRRQDKFSSLLKAREARAAKRRGPA